MAQKRRSTEKPNILVIWGDDIGISNLSCYSDGLMGYRTPSIDRVAQCGEIPNVDLGRKDASADDVNLLHRLREVLGR